MPRSPQENEEIRSHRRECIVRAATRVFAEKGLSRTKVSDIASAAGLSHGLLYHYFASKDAVFEEIVEEMIRRIDADMHCSHPRAIDRIAHAITSRHDLLETDAVDASRVVMQAVLQGEKLSAHVQGRLNAHLTGVLGRLRDWFEEAQADGDIDDSLSAEELTRTTLFLFRGMSIRVPEFLLPLPSAHTLLRLLGPARRVCGHCLRPPGPAEHAMKTLKKSEPSL